jgi:hypothetical protein
MCGAWGAAGQGDSKAVWAAASTRLSRSSMSRAIERGKPLTKSAQG